MIAWHCVLCLCRLIAMFAFMLRTVILCHGWCEWVWKALPRLHGIINPYRRPNSYRIFLYCSYRPPLYRVTILKHIKHIRYHISLSQFRLPIVCMSVSHLCFGLLCCVFYWCSRGDVAPVHIQPDYVEIQRQEWSICERLPLCLPRHVSKHQCSPTS